MLEQIDKFQVALDQSLFTGKELADGKHTVTVGRMPGGTGTHKASTIECAFKERGWSLQSIGI